MANFSPVIVGMTSRRMDRHGSGQFGSTRSGHSHQGLDIVSRAGETVFSPIEGQVIRQAHPYKDDSSLEGVVIRGSGDHAGYEVKLFYVQGLFCGHVSPGSPVGVAQDLTTKYPGITNHVHMEVRYHGKLMNPSDVYGMCF